MKDKTIIAIWAMSLIFTLDALALSMGYNGTGLTLAIAGIAGIGGYKIHEQVSNRFRNST